MQRTPRPVALIILDGWGERKDSKANAIAQAKKPFWDNLLKKYAYTTLSGSGPCVGLPEGQMGNSEVGHLTIGAGRLVYQELTRINLSIQDGSFFQNPVFLNATQGLGGRSLHVLSLVSPGGVHSHENHLKAFITLAKTQGISTLFVHAILDGRDTPPQSAISSLESLINHCAREKCGTIASITGRYYAMDRDNRWDRVQKAYDLLTLGQADYYADNAISALQAAYARGETDEFVKPTLISSDILNPTLIKDGDAVIFMNFRADRARELTQALTEVSFKGFYRKRFPAIQMTTLTEYDPLLKTAVAYKALPLKNILGEQLSQYGLHQLRIAETEKYAHVTFFFNGGIETPYPNEERLLIPSPKVKTYDLQPEMSAPAVTEQLISAIQQQSYDFIVCNYANADMVGHTGNLTATIKAIETVDDCLSQVITALQAVGGEAIVTADHGNAELMYDEETAQPHTAHTYEKVPFIYVGQKAIIAKEKGTLADIAPTILYLLNRVKPPEMTGESLIKWI